MTKKLKCELLVHIYTYTQKIKKLQGEKILLYSFTTSHAFMSQKNHCLLITWSTDITFHSAAKLLSLNDKIHLSIFAFFYSNSKRSKRKRERRIDRKNEILDNCILNRNKLETNGAFLHWSWKFSFKKKCQKY